MLDNGGRPLSLIGLAAGAMLAAVLCCVGAGAWAQTGLGGLDCSTHPSAAMIAGTARSLSGFDAEANGGQSLQGGTYTPPVPGSPITGTALTKLTAALTLTKQPFLDRLCLDLTHFFVDGGADKPYAFWESDSQKAAAGHDKAWVFIGLPQWALLANQPTYSGLETAISNALVNNGVISPTPPYVTKVTGTPNDQNTALLAIIAHEEGHIFAHDFLMPDDNTKTKMCKDSQPFLSTTWASYGPLPQFHIYNTPVLAVHSQHDPFPRNIARDAIANTATANDTYDSLFRNHNFVSLFAALGPDEDIAETFKYYTLLNESNTPLTSLTIAYPQPPSHSRHRQFRAKDSTPSSRDIFRDVLTNAQAIGVKRKLDCIDLNFAVQP